MDNGQKEMHLDDEAGKVSKVACDGIGKSAHDGEDIVCCHFQPAQQSWGTR
jgi:hypothetical protein